MSIIDVAGYNKNSITDGPGLRFVIYCQGCIHNCEGCHNPETHVFGTGVKTEVSEIYSMIKKNPIVKGVTFSGGEPFCQTEAFLELANLLKTDGYEIACYTGFTIEKLMEDKNSTEYKLLQLIDVLIDGKFILSQRNLSLMFKGSENQRVLDVPQSLLQNKAVLCRQPRWVGEQE